MDGSGLIAVGAIDWAPRMEHLAVGGKGGGEEKAGCK